LLFIIYFFLAARPVPREIVLAPMWVSSLTNNLQPDASESLSIDESVFIIDGADNPLLPFTLGSHFGYVDSSGQFAINRILNNNIYLSQNMWTEFGAEPSRIEIKNIMEETILNIDNVRGYPVLLDNRIFIFGSEQNSLSEIDERGNILWTYEFGAPLTCIDAKAGLLLTGSLDGVIEIFNSSGERIFYFEPGGSRYEVILGCALSSDGSRIGIICGIDQQRFLLLERFGNTGGTASGVISSDYKVVYHEFLDSGFRRPVRILFIDDDKRIVFERSGGISSYNIRTRRLMFIPLDGAIYTLEDSGEQGFLFIVTSSDDDSADHEVFDDQLKKLIGIRFPQDRWFNFSFGRSSFVTNTDVIFLRAPFKSDDVFLGRMRTAALEHPNSRSMLVIGGGTVLISFALEEK